MRCRIYIAAKKWDVVVDVANSIVLTDMSYANAWLHRSLALHELAGRKKPTTTWTPPLTCSPVTGASITTLPDTPASLDAKRKRGSCSQLLSDAIELADDAKAVKLMALDDPALESFWAEIGES